MNLNDCHNVEDFKKLAEKSFKDYRKDERSFISKTVITLPCNVRPGFENL